MQASKWRFLGVSVQGTSHLEKNTPCQDAHTCLQTPNGELLLAVADGAGSAERSQEGAQLAVKQAVSTLMSALQSDVPDSESGWREMIHLPVL
jgi:serine/threonine protein phosphatase PrpC